MDALPAQGQITVEVVIPPNASARVTLPGRDEERGTLDVAAGTYHWSYPYQQEKVPALPNNQTRRYMHRRV